MLPDTTQATTDPFPALSYPAFEHLPFTLETGEVQLWLADLDLGEELTNKVVRTLSKDEAQRARRFRRDRERRRFITGRGLLRRLLERYTGIDRDRIRFNYGPHGKPVIEGDGPLFNLAHSKGHMLLGVTSNAPIGVDIEQIRQIKEFEGIARRFFAPDEWRTVVDAPQSERLMAFMTCWTCKEAYIKAVGYGFTRPLRDFVVKQGEGGAACIESIAGDRAKAAHWSLYRLNPVVGVIGALATQGDELHLTTYRLSSSEILS